MLTCLSVSAAAQSLQQLYDQHRWFELRGSVGSQEAPALYRGAVASAFNDRPKAEKYLNEVIGSAPRSQDAENAREKLADLYNRAGMSREALRQFDAILRVHPGRSDVKNVRPIFASFSHYPDQSIGKQHRTLVHAEVSKKGVVIPVTVNGKTVHWGLDTDFSMSIMSESEARLLGLVVDNVSAQAGDSNGGSTQVRATVVRRLSIGDVQLRNVPFIVMPDSQEPWNELPSGKKGLIGLPVAVALKAIRWKADGTFEIGFEPDRLAVRKDEICFDGLNPITRAHSEGKELDFILDTGNSVSTELWSRFSDDFSARVKQEGTKSTKQILEVGGTSVREMTVLPEVDLRVGGLDTKLKPAEIFSTPVGDRFHHGLLGMDVLSQAGEVRIDFRSMTLSLLP